MRVYQIMSLIVVAVATPASGGSAGPPVLLKAADLPVAIEPAELQRQFNALSAMPDIQVTYSIHGPINWITGDTGLFVPAEDRDLEVGDSANAVLERLGPVLLATGRETLTVKSHDRRTRLGPTRSLILDQSIRGTPVYGGSVTIEYDETYGRILGVGANFLPDRNLPRAAAVTAEQASDAAVRALEASGDAVHGSVHQVETPSLSYVGLSSESPQGHLAWGMRVSYECPTGRGDDQLVWIDAIDKAILARRPAIRTIQALSPCQLPALVDCEAEAVPSIADAPISSSSNLGESRPQLLVERIGCSNRFRVSWPRIPGALQYQALRTRKDAGWIFASTLAAGYVNQCTTQVDVPTVVKMRACDECGCGQWSDVQSMDPKAKCP